MKKTTILCSVALLFSACTSGGTMRQTETVTTLDGTPVQLSTLIEGKPTILNFWASWCSFCAVELPVFQNFANAHPMIKFVGINLQENPEVAAKYWQNGGYTMTALLDPKSKLKAEFQVVTQPTTLFLNAQGEIVDRRDGPLTQEELLMYAKKIEPEATISPLQMHHSEDQKEGKAQTSKTPEFLRRWYREAPEQVEHTIDFSDMLSGGVEKDGIPSIDTPKFISTAEADDLLEEDDVGTLFINGDTTRFYPFKILNWHEIVNDTVGNKNIMVTYCPLCDSAAVYSRALSIGTTTFGVSGFLFQSNLVMYDRRTESLWNQITGKAMIGELVGEELELLPSNVVKFSTVLSEYPEAEVLSTETGFIRDYAKNPYRGYADDEGIMFPVHVQDDRLMNKARVLGLVINGVQKAYSRTLIDGKNITDTVGGKTIEITWENGRSTFLIDGVRREPFHTFWFAWVAQYPETEVYEE